MMPVLRWAPATLMAVGAIFTVGVDSQRSLPLRAPLAAVVPDRIAGFHGRDVTVSDAELRVAGVTDYLMRVYGSAAAVRDPNAAAAGADAWLSVYVGYYAEQMQGKTIHSPKNCLPGSGWEALASRAATIDTPAGSVTVNRYLLQRESERALVLYWYQGRGRVEASEYGVKWDLLRDAALRRRSDEALVRIVVPVTRGEDQAFKLAAQAAAALIPTLYQALPA